MTPITLLEQLKAFVERQVKDIILPVRPIQNRTTAEYAAADSGNVTQRPPEVHLMRLPSKDAEKNCIPYIVLQILKGGDSQASGDFPASECRVRIVAVTYDEDMSLGMMSVLNIITRLRAALLRAGQVGQFLLKPGLEWIVYDDDLHPYYCGEIAVTFELPEIEREVHFHGQE
jgi:hypothetical protein